MDWMVIPAEYDMPFQRETRTAARWALGFVAIALIIGAGLALAKGSHTESSVSVPTSH